MCGVAAAVGPRAADQVDLMIRKMAYRGVRSKVEYGSGWAVGHVRLPVVGVGPDYDQPVKRWQWVLGWVGEILDFRDRDASAECDTDLVLNSWSQTRWDAFLQFDGFWSVVAQDVNTGVLYGLTDYLSQKPLYVRNDNYATAVASEPDAVVALGLVGLDPVYLSAIIKWGYCPETWRTPYRSIRRLGPGELVRIYGPGDVKYEVVDRLQPTGLSLSGLKQEVETAVRRRVTSADVPVAALVSGGLDSSIVYTLAGRYGDLKPYHVENNEWEQCAQVAPGAERVVLPAADPGKCLDYHQEPVDLGSLEPQVALSDAVRAAGPEVVVLTGDGADELFGGYSRSLRYDSQSSDVWHELVGWHLPRLDRVMMRNRLEVRSPFLARRVASAALALPWIKRQDKAILRDLFRADLPAGVSDTPKKALRVRGAGVDREARSIQLVELFKRRVEDAAGYR